MWKELLHCRAWVGCHLPLLNTLFLHFDPLVTPALLASCWPLDEDENRVPG